MAFYITGLMAAEGEELKCAGCGKVMTHPKEYVSIQEERKPSRDLCVKCAGKEGILWIAGLMVIKEMKCDGCGRTMKHAERYGYIQYTGEEGKPPARLCQDCSRVRGYLEWKKDERGQMIESFL